jgi:hypothetical protein
MKSELQVLCLLNIFWGCCAFLVANKLEKNGNGILMKVACLFLHLRNFYRTCGSLKKMGDEATGTKNWLWKIGIYREEK